MKTVVIISTRVRSDGSTFSLVRDAAGRTGILRSGEAPIWGEPLALAAHTLFRGLKRSDGSPMFPHLRNVCACGEIACRGCAS
jgi:hypothetical protein